METLQPGPATIRHLARRFGLPESDGSLRDVARGSMGRVWRLEVPTRRYAVKEFFWGTGTYAERDAKAEVRFRDAAVQAGIAAPASIPNVEGNYVERLPADLGGAVVRLGTWVDGRAVQTTDHRRAHYLGQTLGVLHALEHPTDAVPDPYFTTPPAAERWTELVERTAMARSLVPSIADRLPTRLPAIAALTDLVDTSPRTDLICSHRDVGPANVLVGQTSGAFTLIDWDEIGPISPSRELASQLWTWHLHNGQPDTAGIRETVTAYREAGGTADISDLGAFSFGLACDLNYLADEIAAAMDTELPPSMREYAEREAERFLADLPSPGQLAAIVQAARTA